MKYKIGDIFYLDGGESICNEYLKIFNILLPNEEIKEPKYLCICKRDSDVNGTFSNIFYEIMDDYILESCDYEYRILSKTSLKGGEE